MTRLAPGREQEIRELEAATTPGPWAAILSMVVPESALAYDHPRWYAVAECYEPTRATSEAQNNRDAAFIAAAREAIPALLAELDALRADLAAAVKVAEAARRVLELYRYQTNGPVPKEFRALESALAACPVPTSEGGKG